MPKNTACKKFGRLTIIKEFIKNNRAYCEVQCDCGNTKIVKKSSLINGHTKSCGCLSRQTSSKLMKKILSEKIQPNYIDGTCLLSLGKTLYKNNKSGYRGVYRDKENKIWIAYITYKGKYYYLGGYKDLQDAVDARKRAEDKYFRPILEKFEKEV